MWVQVMIAYLSSNGEVCKEYCGSVDDAEPGKTLRLASCSR
jgi:hypothetical protein